MAPRSPKARRPRSSAPAVPSRPTWVPGRLAGAAMALLSLRGLAAGYGGITAIKGIDIDVDEGEIVTLIGSNGAGKSTTLRAISGLVRPRSGTVEFAGAAID